MSLVEFAVEDEIAIVTINRPEARNAVDQPTAAALADAFRRFDADDALSVAILTGAGGTFCAGADLKAVATSRGNRVTEDGDGPLGCTRMLLGKPVIAAVEGFAVAGGLELALWCDLRVAELDATFGVYCRRFGVPLCDGGTIRLPRLIGMSRAMDMILTGRGTWMPEVAFAVLDEFHHRGIATILLEHLSLIADANGVTEFEADVLGENRQMLELFAHSGFEAHNSIESGVVHLHASTRKLSQK